MVEKKSKKKIEGVLRKEISRRDFIKTTALGAAGLSLSSWASVPFTYGAEPPIKIGMYQEVTGWAAQYGYWMTKVGKAAIAPHPRRRRLRGGPGIDHRGPSRGVPVLLRPGAITRGQLAGVLGTAPRDRDAQAPRASGTLAAHYAPRTPLVLVEAGEVEARVRAAASGGKRVALLALGRAPTPLAAFGRPAPGDAPGYGHDSMRTCAPSTRTERT